MVGRPPEKPDAQTTATRHFCDTHQHPHTVSHHYQHHTHCFRGGSKRAIKKTAKTELHHRRQCFNRNSPTERHRNAHKLLSQARPQQNNPGMCCCVPCVVMAPRSARVQRLEMLSLNQPHTTVPYHQTRHTRSRTMFATITHAHTHTQPHARRLANEDTR